MEDEQNLSGEGSPELVSTPGTVTPELAASLPLNELKERLRAEAEQFESAATATQGTPGGESEDEEPEADAATGDTGAARGEQVERTAAAPSTQGQATERGQRPQTLEEAIRVLDSVRGNLNTAVSQRSALEKRLQELEAAAARQQREAEEQKLQEQHRRFEEAVSRLPTQEGRDNARAEYMNRLGRQALGEYQRTIQQQEQDVARREFEVAKRDVPGMYEDIAKFVAQQHDIPESTLLEFVKSPRIDALVRAAQSQEALQAVSLVLGETLDEMATREAGRRAAEKSQRREAKAATAVRDMPAGTTPGGANEDEVARINSMTPDQFAAFKKRLLRASAATR